MLLVPSPDVLAARLQDEVVLLHTGDKRYFRLNGTGAAIWKFFEEGLDRDAALSRLAAEYDVNDRDAAAAYDELSSELQRAGLLLAAPVGESAGDA